MAAKKTKTVRHKDLTREAYNDIRRMIFSNELNPGQKVPYRRMADGLKMSLTPVVQALKHMEFMGLVRHEQNKGFFIENVTPEEINEAYELRRILEPRLLAETIPRLDAAGEKHIEKALDEYLRACRKGSLKLKLVKDIQFHMSMAELSGQKLSILMLRHLFDFLYLRFSQELLFSRPWEDASKAHSDIFSAIKERDVPKATALLEAHITGIHQNALEGIEDRLSDQEEIIF